MKLILHLWSWAMLALAAAPALGQNQIPWVADFPSACGMAAEQRRLILLHFYNDNCGPCVRLEQNVFCKSEVAEALSQNYIPVKVHAGKNPQLASRYRVTQWPTDVFVTPAGLEVYRTISPKDPADYIALLHQVALQSGVGAARQWKTQLTQANEPLTANVQRAADQAQQRWAGAGSQYQAAADQARAAAGPAAQYLSDAARQSQQQATGVVQGASNGAKQWGLQAGEAAQQYEQQAGDSYRRFREQAGQAGEQVQAQAQAVKQELRAAGQQASEQIGDAGRELRRQWAPGGMSFDRRSAFVPADPSPAASSPLAGANGPASQSPQVAALPPRVAASPTPQPAPPQAAASPSQPQTPASSPVTATQLPTNNPWVTPRPKEPAIVAAAPGAPASQPPLSSSPFVPASQAPPIGLDGFCPVTLIETVARDPNDRSAWKKGDRQFGAIHRGRTYLFASAEQQQKFLVNPDAFAPALAGCDPVRFAEHGELVDGKRAYGLVTPERQIYLFADEASRNRFEQSPAEYSTAIRQALLRSESGNLYR